MREYPIGFTLIDFSSRDLATVPEFMKGINMYATLAILPELDKPNPVFNFVRYKVVECTTDIMKPEYYDKLKALSAARTMFCIDFREGTHTRTGEPVTDAPIVKNEYTESDSAFLDLFIKRCYEDGKPCSDYVTSSDTFFMKMYTLYSYVNSKDFDSPVQSMATTRTVPITYALSKREYVNIQIGTLVSDSGWLFDDSKEKTWVYQGSITESVNIQNERNSLMHGFTYSSPKLRKVHYRRYLKVQELMAQLGGFIKFFMVMAKAMCVPMSNFVFFNKMRLHINSTHSALGKTTVVNNLVTDDSSHKIKLPQKIKLIEKVSWTKLLRKILFSNNKRFFDDIGKYRELTFISKKIIEFEKNIEETKTKLINIKAK